MKKITSRRIGKVLASAVALHFMLPACAVWAHESAGGGRRSNRIR